MTLFSHFETTSQAERADIARRLKTLYNHFYTREAEAFYALRNAASGIEYLDAQKRYIAASANLGAIQAVFHELSIPFDGLYSV